MTFRCDTYIHGSINIKPKSLDWYIYTDISSTKSRLKTIIGDCAFFQPTSSIRKVSHPLFGIQTAKIGPWLIVWFPLVESFVIQVQNTTTVHPTNTIELPNGLSTVSETERIDQRPIFSLVNSTILLRRSTATPWDAMILYGGVVHAGTYVTRDVSQRCF